MPKSDDRRQTTDAGPDQKETTAYPQCYAQRCRQDTGFCKSEIENRKSKMHAPGQAMVEFMVGLVVMLVLLAGLIQIGQLAHAHTRTMNDARTRAGQLAMADGPSDPNAALLISDWVPNAPTNPLATLAASLNPAGDFFLVKGEASASVPILPIIRRLVYAHSTLEVESEAWLVWTKGIY